MSGVNTTVINQFFPHPVTKTTESPTKGQFLTEVHMPNKLIILPRSKFKIKIYGG